MIINYVTAYYASLIRDTLFL